MSQSNLSFKISPMCVGDIAAAVEIEKAAFGLELPIRDYYYELEQNQLAHYFVLHVLPAQRGQDQSAPSSFNAASLIGLAGFWLIGRSAHIMTLAIQDCWRGMGLGEWLLLALVMNGQALGATTATLEVRPSNQIAISLYKKYNFQEVGRRTAYYSDNGEDALILTTPSITLADYQALLTQRQHQLTKRLEQIRVDNISLLG